MTDQPTDVGADVRLYWTNRQWEAERERLVTALTEAQQTVKDLHADAIERDIDLAFAVERAERAEAALKKVDEVLTNPRLWMLGPEEVARSIARVALAATTPTEEDGVAGCERCQGPCKQPAVHYR